MWAYRPKLRPAEIHPALHSFADECTAVIGRLLAYVGALALIAIVGNQLLADLPVVWHGVSPAGASGWSLAVQSHPAFAVTQIDSALKTETYDIFRHPEGGRKDIIRWATGLGTKPIAELGLYRPGTETPDAGPPTADIAAGMGFGEARHIETAGVVDTKFGYVSLLGFADTSTDHPPCLGFIKNFGEANLRISGWSCQPGSPSVRRTAISCMLDHLILLTAGNDPKLAELFAHAELKRGACRAAASTASADWVTSPQNPRLRGSF
jgi:hypothetical protein